MQAIFEVVFSDDRADLGSLLKEALTSHGKGAEATDEQWKEGFSNLTPECINFLTGYRGSCRTFVAVPAHPIPSYKSSLYSEGKSYAFFFEPLRKLSQHVSGLISYIGPDYVCEFENGQQITEISFRNVDDAMSRHSNDDANADEYAYLREIWRIRGQPWSPGSLVENYYASDFARLLYASVRRHRDSFEDLGTVEVEFSLHLSSTTLSLQDYPNLVVLLERVCQSKDTLTLDSFGSFVTAPRRSSSKALVTDFKAASELRAAIDAKSRFIANTDTWPSDLPRDILSGEISTFIDALNDSDLPVTLGTFLQAKVEAIPERVGRNPKTGEKVIVPPRRVLFFGLYRPYTEME